MSELREEKFSIRGWMFQVVAWFVIASVALVLAVAVLIPRIGGATPYTILTGSMKPGMPPGTLVVIKPVDPAKIGVGSVVTYQVSSGDPTVVTHRVVSQGSNLKGELEFRTQGDANNTPDEKQVLPVQIKGERWYSVPYVGYLNNALTGSQRQIGVVVTAAGLLGYAGLMFFGALRDRRKTQPRHLEGAAR